MFLKEDMHFNFLPFILATTVNTLNVHGTSQTQQGMSVIQRTRSESGLYWAKAGLVAFDASLYCINTPYDRREYRKVLKDSQFKVLKK